MEEIGDAQEDIMEFLRDNKKNALRLTAKALDLDVAAVEEMYEYYDFSTEIEEADKEGFQKTADFMYESGMIENKLDVNTLFYK